MEPLPFPAILIQFPVAISVSGDASSLNLTEESPSQYNMGTGLTTIVTVKT